MGSSSPSLSVALCVHPPGSLKVFLFAYALGAAKLSVFGRVWSVVTQSPGRSPLPTSHAADLHLPAPRVSELCGVWRERGLPDTPAVSKVLLLL